ncbi:MAG: response regulator [Deltaproteobacteria bacterium]|nr:response regulator [Deltaproteobacteria bacterium]
MINKDSKKILVVDDDEAIRHLCDEVLSVAGYKVDLAINGLAGLHMVKSEEYDLIISDISMPELGGIDFYISALRDFPHLKDRFVFITGYIPEDLHTIVNQMKLKYILKPFRIADLLNCVENLMSKTLQELYPGKDVMGKRLEGRFEIGAECDLFEEDSLRHRYMAGKTFNISRNGISISYEGEPLAPDTPVSVYLSINSLNIHRGAKVIWSKPDSEAKSSSGLQFYEPIPVSSIVNAVPSAPLSQAQPKGLRKSG